MTLTVAADPPKRSFPARRGFVWFHAEVARESLSLGETRAARAALLELMPADFGAYARRAEGLIAVLRDRRATDHEIGTLCCALLMLLPR